jgi:hypothetical protein
VKFTLKPYQEDAVASALANLERARELFHRDGDVSSFSLTAATGSGKTVMAAAAIEALFFGNADLGIDPDPGAVVIWFSDDPNLNDQSRLRLLEASDKLSHTHLVTVKPPFDKPRLEPRKVYFLNAQRLGKNSLLTRGYVENPDDQYLEYAPTPDLQGRTIWETIGNTINDDDLTLYLVLDEAHRGFNGKNATDKPTIVRRLVTGEGVQPPIPVVWGISATIERFRDAMSAADATKDRRALPPVIVDPSLVQESGLVKDTVALNIPNEAGNFDSVLVRLGARKLRESSERWAEYAKSQGLADPVRPLLVLQTPNTPNPDEIGVALDTIFAEYPDLRANQVRHVLGEHSTQKFGAWEVDWIEPQYVEDNTYVRILVAKDAISTGWDCPRAEVLVSFRSAKDNTHITQLLGRMVRSPLARRVQGDELLNSVDCILPFFDRTTAGNVVKYLTGQLAEMPGTAGKKVLLDGRALVPNPEVPEEVWQVWDALPKETLPQRGARPIKRLVTLAQALSADGLRPGALKEVEAEMHAVLDGYATRYAKQLDEAVKEIWAVQVQQIAGRVGKTGLTYQEFVERADDRAIRTGFEGAKKAFGADIAQSYVDHLVGPNDDDDSLREAFVRAAALATVKEAREKIDQEATEVTNNWFTEHRVAIKALTDDRQAVYEEIKAMAVDPQRTFLSRPRTRLEDYAVVDQNEQVGVAPLAPLHLMSDENGEFPLSSLNEWERQVVRAEIDRDSIRGWYRNPSRQAVDSLGIAYRDDKGNWHSMHPDFVFFHEVQGEISASIVDPHGHHLPDADSKLKTLAKFAVDYGADFHRIEAVSEVDGRMRVLDMQRSEVRDSVLAGKQAAIDFYRSPVAIEYDTKHLGRAHGVTQESAIRIS